MQRRHVFISGSHLKIITYIHMRRCYTDRKYLKVSKKKGLKVNVFAAILCVKDEIAITVARNTTD